MNGQEQGITESDLLAYVDGELTARERERVEQHLRGDAAAAALVEEWRAQTARLDALYGHVAREAVPNRLRPSLLPRPRQRVGGSAWRQLAAALALLALGAGSGWFAHALLPAGRPAPEPFVAQAVEAHDLFSGEVMHPVEVRGEEGAHLQAWLSKRLDRKLSIPDLSPLGLTLVGGRLLPAGNGAPAAQIMYEETGGQRLTLYVVPTADSQDTAFRYASLNGLEAISWTDEDVGCALIGDVPLARLQIIAKSAYGQLV